MVNYLKIFLLVLFFFFFFFATLLRFATLLTTLLRGDATLLRQSDLGHDFSDAELAEAKDVGKLSWCAVLSVGKP
ncbi:MAG: hypothetical protein IKN59_01400 [Paludibacteraceae bacterium]|nr:hypothetical protein [Paludibacteraceae bacterium]